MIWIPGAKGMLGTHLTRYLTLKKIPWIGSSFDISDRAQVEAFASSEKITHIINCAAYTKVDLAEKEQEKAFLANVIGPENLGSLSLPLVHISTDYVFDGTSKTPYTEEATPNPLNVYGFTKLEGEKRVPHACILRTSWLFGSGPNFVRTMIKLMQEKETLSIVADQWGRPTYAEDLAIAAYQMLGQSGIYHFANAGETSWYDYAKTIQELYPTKVKINPIPSSQYPTPAKRPAYSTLSTAKIEKHIQPRPWKEALLEYLRSLKCEK